MTPSNIPPSLETPAPQMPGVPTAAVEALRQAFFSRVLSTIHSPMDLLPTLQKAFPECATLPEALTQLDDLKKCLDSFRPLNADQLGNLQKAWDTEYTYESNRIEGNTLTLAETSLVINEGITVAGKTIHEHLEAINHKEAIDYLRSIVDGTEAVSEWMIKSLHELILKNHSKYHDQRGRYRSVPVMITGTTFVPPQPWQVQKLMEDLIIHYQEKKDTVHPVALAADMHAELVGIHPFIDGNGRTSRLFMNFILLRAGFPIANISGDTAKRNDYYESLNESHIQKNDEPFRWLVAQYVRIQLFQYLAMVSGDISEKSRGKGAYFFERMSQI